MYPQDSNESCLLNASALLTKRQKNALFAARKSPKEEAKFCSVKANAKMVTLLLCWCFSCPVPRLVDNLCSVSLCYVLQQTHGVVLKELRATVTALTVEVKELCVALQ